MDCKDLIERLWEHSQSLVAYNIPDLSHDLEDAITTIEILLAEREAAVKGKHAHVVVNWLGDCHCSSCGENIDGTSNYCNWCGAKLDEPEQRED